MNLSKLQKRTREFYENQADEFNRTRQYVWPSTKKILDSIDFSSNPNNGNRMCKWKKYELSLRIGYYWD